jgi:hypothetical protein
VKRFRCGEPIRETNGRTGDARIRAAGSMSLRRFPRQGERIGLMQCRRLAVSPIRLLALTPEVITGTLITDYCYSGRRVSRSSRI